MRAPRLPHVLVATVAGVLIALLAGCGSGHHNAPTCRSQYVTQASSPPASWASTTLLGPTAPAPYELYGPSDGSVPHGVMIGIHGGGWETIGPWQLTVYRPEALYWASRGWAFASLDYHACDRSLSDVLRLHDLIRQVIGPTTPICVTGQSAGAHLALLLAALRPTSISCVIAEAPPTQAGSLASGAAYNAATGKMDSPLPIQLADVWRSAFGAGWDGADNPIAQGDKITARVLLARGQRDPIIPESQVTDMQAALHNSPWVRALPDLAPGDVAFPHTSISPAAAQTFQKMESEITQPWSTTTTGVPPTVPGWWPVAAPAPAPAVAAPPPPTTPAAPAPAAPAPAAPPPAAPAPTAPPPTAPLSTP